MKVTVYMEVIRRISLPVIALLITACQPEVVRDAASIAEQVSVRLGMGISSPVNAASADTRSMHANTVLPDVSGKAFTVSLVRDSSADAASTRAVKAAFYNLWAFQFNASGNIMGIPQQLSTSQTPVEEGANLSVSLTVGKNQTIYLVSGGKKLTPNFADIKTLAELEAYKLGYIVSDRGAYTSAIVETADIPYVGFIKGVNVVSLGQGAGMLEYNSPEGFSGSIGMRELVSKVTLRYKYDVQTHTLQGVRLQNVNSDITLGSPAAGVEFKLLNLQTGTPDAQGYYTASWYVAQNMQGTNEKVTNEFERYYKKGGDLAPEHGLCLEVLGKDKNAPTKYSVHRIFVGKNNTSNFDVEANHHYSLTTEFTTGYVAGNNTDPRLDVSEFKGAGIVFYSSKLLTSGGLCTIPGGATYDLDAHYDYRPITVAIAGSSVELGIYSDPACTKLTSYTDPAQNWLKLSVEPNYTLAVNNRISPLANRMSLEARVPAKLNFYLYNDEYVNVKQDNTSPKRSLYLKITTTELDVANPRKTVDRMQIDQRPIKVYGQFGGWNDTSKEYTSLVGMDQIEEYRYAYTQPAPAPMTSGIPGGCYLTVSGFPITSDLSHGLKPTVVLAENQGNWEKLTHADLSYMEMPRKTGGKIDLYQYTYYNTFAWRYCYDRNRDLDGNGILENSNSKGENEIKWYVPSGCQALGCNIDGGSLGLIWTSFASGRSGGALTSSSGELSSNLSYFLKRSVRCVRDLTLTSPVVSTSPKVLTESLANTNGDGETAQYAVIDASQIPGATTRGEEFYVEVPLFEYLEAGGGAKIMEPDGVTQKKVRRIKRHEILGETNRLISKKFAVAPDNINGNGVHSNLPISWANAGGWDALANTKDYTDTESFRAVEQGCPVYKGRNGKDVPGSWRLPTQKEIILMLIYSKKIYATSGNIGFVNLTSSYCAATELSESHCANIYMMQAIGGLGKTGSYPTFYARCIRDIP